MENIKESLEILKSVEDHRDIIDSFSCKQCNDKFSHIKSESY